MSIFRVACGVIGLAGVLALTACVEAPPATPAPAPVEAPKPVVRMEPPPVSETERETFVPRPQARPHIAPTHPAQQTRAPEPVVPAPVATPSAPAPAASEPAASNSPVAAAKAAGAEWLAACQRVQKQGTALMCDADRLLAPPSDKVRVYVRDPRLVRKYEGGFTTVLRESLPRLYRIFLIE